MTNDIYVLIEHLQGQVSDISYMMLAAGRPLAEASGGSLVAILLGQDSQDMAGNLGADQVLYVEHPTLATFNPEAMSFSITGLLFDDGPMVATIFVLTELVPGRNDSLFFMNNIPVLIIRSNDCSIKRPLQSRNKILNDGW